MTSLEAGMHGDNGSIGFDQILDIHSLFLNTCINWTFYITYELTLIIFNY